MATAASRGSSSCGAAASNRLPANNSSIGGILTGLPLSARRSRPLSPMRRLGGGRGDGGPREWRKPRGRGNSREGWARRASDLRPPACEARSTASPAPSGQAVGADSQRFTAARRLEDGRATPLWSGSHGFLRWRRHRGLTAEGWGSHGLHRTRASGPWQQDASSRSVFPAFGRGVATALGRGKTAARSRRPCAVTGRHTF